MTKNVALGEPYARQRHALIIAGIPTMASVTLCLLAIYIAVDTATRPAWIGPWLGPYLVEALAPLALLWLALGPLRQHAERVVLACELAFTGGLLSHLLLPETYLSSAAMMVSLKLLATALFVPWHPRVQFVSAQVSYALYLTLAVAGGHLGPELDNIHHALGPLFAVFLSCAGARLGENSRRALFERSVEVENSHQQLQALLENAPDIVLVIDDEGLLLYASPSSERVLGLAPNLVVGRTAAAFVHPDDAPWVARRFLDAARQVGVAVATTYRVAHADGSWRNFEVTAKRMPAGSPIDGFVVNGRDVTDRRRTELEREALLEVKSAMAQAGQELISALGEPDLIDRLCRLSAATLAGDASHTFLLQPEERVYSVVAGHGDTDALRNRIRSLRLPAIGSFPFLEALRRERVLVCSKRCNLDLGMQPIQSAFDIGTAIYIGLWRASELVGVQAITYRDPDFRVTPAQIETARGLGQLGSLALEQTRLIERLEAANRIKSDFVATMSHELRTPLNVIIGYADLLIDETFGPLTEEQQDTLRRVGNNARELLDLITATLDLSRLEGGRTSFDWRDVHVADMVRTIDAETRTAGIKPGVRLLWRIGADLPRLRTDPLKLRVILKNLINNAVKFTDNGHVAVSIEGDGLGMRFSVADTGIGIAPEARDAIFEPFHQTNASLTSRFGGVGLGLHIVRRLVTLLDGTIRVDSEPGRGSTFHVWLPSAQPQSAHAEVSAQHG